MDAGFFSNLVPDSWASRILDGLGTVGLIMMRNSHARAEKQNDRFQEMMTEHEVFRERMKNLTETVAEAKKNTDQIIRILIQCPR